MNFHLITDKEREHYSMTGYPNVWCEKKLYVFIFIYIHSLLLKPNGGHLTLVCIIECADFFLTAYIFLIWHSPVTLTTSPVLVCIANRTCKSKHLLESKVI